MMEEKPAPGAAAPIQQFVYGGRLSELYRIFLINLALGIVTLSIYRFWGKTNLRRYIWSSMSLQGHAFEYTGTGGELFKGFLIVMGFYLVFYIALVILGVALGDVVGVGVQLLLIGFILYITFVAQYAAQRYRLTRTLWRGIRGGMTGSAWSYGGKATLFALLNMITLTLCGPWTSMRLTEDRFNNSYFGDGQTTLHGRAGPLMPSYLLGIFLAIMGLGVLVGLIAFWAMAGGSFDVFLEVTAAQEESRSPDVTLEETATMAIHLVLAIFAFFFGIAVVATIAFAPYAAAFFRELAAGLGFTGLRFKSRVGAGNYMALWIGNIAWVIFTFGLGLPVAAHRSLKFFAQRLEIHGVIDTERLRQGKLVRPRTGEGLLEVFDPGFF